MSWDVVSAVVEIIGAIGVIASLTAEELHYQYLKGTLDPEIWTSWKGIVSLYSTSPGFSEYWNQR